MAKGDVVIFQTAMYDLLKGTHGDLSAATIKCGIVDDTITPVANLATPNWSDFVANEVATTGNYTANGETLTTVVLAMVGGIATLTADDVVVAEHASGFLDGYWAIIHNSTASGAAIFAIDLGGPESEQAGDVSIEFSGGVVFQLPANVLTWETP
jgi:hypothetical protein